MVNSSSVRNNNRQKFNEVIELRKQGLSYGEIRKVIPISKSTLHCWVRLSGLTKTKEHLEIQLKKRIENKRVATEAAMLVRKERINKDIEAFLISCESHLLDPLFIAGVIAYEAEGGKLGCKFSNSDYRLILIFTNFLNKYIAPIQKLLLGYRIYVHETRSMDLNRIKKHWSKKLSIEESEMKLTWKKNIIKKRRTNSDYVGQMMVTVSSKLILKKLQKLSDIIMKEHYGIV